MMFETEAGRTRALLPDGNPERNRTSLAPAGSYGGWEASRCRGPGLTTRPLLFGRREEVTPCWSARSEAEVARAEVLKMWPKLKLSTSAVPVVALHELC